MEKFQELVLKELPSLMRYATALTGNYQNAENLLASCLEISLQQVDHRDPNNNIKYWLLAIIHNIYMEPDNKFRDLPQTQDEIDHDSDSKFDKLSLQKLQIALRNLPPLQKQVFILITLEEIPYKDVREITELTLANIMALLHKSRQTMRQQTFRKVLSPKVATNGH